MAEAKLSIDKCPYCGSDELVDAEVFTRGGLQVGTSRRTTTPVRMWVCRNCGSVVHAFVEDPEMMFPRRQRKKKKSK